VGEEGHEDHRHWEDRVVVWTTKDVQTAWEYYKPRYKGKYGQHKQLCKTIAKMIGRDYVSVDNKLKAMRYTEEYKVYIEIIAGDLQGARGVLAESNYIKVPGDRYLCILYKDGSEYRLKKTPKHFRVIEKYESLRRA
jgi:hypothetical protein